MKNKFGYLMLILAVLIAGTAAFFSVYGLGQLFAGSSSAVIMMASVLEVGKIIITTALHTYWKSLNKILKIYLTIAVGILMIITSTGIYGFLSNAYQKTANQLEIHEGEVNVLITKKEAFEATIEQNNKLVEDKVKEKEETSNRLNKRISNIDFTKNNQSKRADIATAEGNKRLNVINSEIDVLNTKNAQLLDSVNKYNVMALELKSGSKVAGEVGPLKYISELTGIPMANVVNYLILLLIFVFDPLAIALVLATNRIFELNGQQTPLEPKQPDYDGELMDIIPSPATPDTYVHSEEEFDEDHALNEVITQMIDDLESDDDEEYLEPNEVLMKGKDEYYGESSRIWDRVKRLKKDGKLPSPTQEDIENEPSALAFTPYAVEENDNVTELPEVISLIQEELKEEEKEEVKNEDIVTNDEVKESNERGFSVNIPTRKNKSSIQRIGSNKEIRDGENDKIFFNKG